MAVGAAFWAAAALQLLEANTAAAAQATALLHTREIAAVSADGGGPADAALRAALAQLRAGLSLAREGAPPAAPGGAAHRAGMLRKLSGRTTMALLLRSRWVVLQGAQLSYYADESEALLKGVLQLQGARVAPVSRRVGAGFAFEVTAGGDAEVAADPLNPLHRSKRRYVWVASSAGERDGWVAAIARAAGLAAVEAQCAGWARRFSDAPTLGAYAAELARFAREPRTLRVSADWVRVHMSASQRRGAGGAHGAALASGAGGSSGLASGLRAAVARASPGRLLALRPRSATFAGGGGGGVGEAAHGAGLPPLSGGGGGGGSGEPPGSPLASVALGNRKVARVLQKRESRAVDAARRASVASAAASDASPSAATAPSSSVLTARLAAAEAAQAEHLSEHLRASLASVAASEARRRGEHAPGDRVTPQQLERDLVRDVLSVNGAPVAPHAAGAGGAPVRALAALIEAVACALTRGGGGVDGGAAALVVAAAGGSGTAAASAFLYGGGGGGGGGGGASLDTVDDSGAQQQARSPAMSMSVSRPSDAAASALAALHGHEARALAFCREVLLCSSRTTLGGDTFDAVEMLFGCPGRVLVMPGGGTGGDGVEPISLDVVWLPATATATAAAAAAGARRPYPPPSPLAGDVTDPLAAAAPAMAAAVAAHAAVGIASSYSDDEASGDDYDDDDESTIGTSRLGGVAGSSYHDAMDAVGYSMGDCGGDAGDDQPLLSQPQQLALAQQQLPLPLAPHGSGRGVGIAGVPAASTPLIALVRTPPVSPAAGPLVAPSMVPSTGATLDAATATRATGPTHVHGGGTQRHHKRWASSPAALSLDNAGGAAGREGARHVPLVATGAAARAGSADSSGPGLPRAPPHSGGPSSLPPRLAARSTPGGAQATVAVRVRTAMVYRLLPSPDSLEAGDGAAAPLGLVVATYERVFPWSAAEPEPASVVLELRACEL